MLAVVPHLSTQAADREVFGVDEVNTERGSVATVVPICTSAAQPPGLEVQSPFKFKLYTCLVPLPEFEPQAVIISAAQVTGVGEYKRLNLKPTDNIMEIGRKYY